MAFRTLKPGTLLAPVPAVLVSAGAETERGPVRNLMTAAWAGTVCSEPPMVSVSIRPSRYTYELVKQSGEFVIHLTDRKLLRAADYCGVRSGREEDKFAACGLTPVPVEGFRHAPAIAQAPVYLACRTEQELNLGSHVMFIGRIERMGVREDLMDERGGIRLQDADLIAYSHGVYQTLGDVLGFFGFSVASPEARKRRMRQAARKREPK